MVLTKRIQNIVWEPGVDEIESAWTNMQTTFGTCGESWTMVPAREDSYRDASFPTMVLCYFGSLLGPWGNHESRFNMITLQNLENHFKINKKKQYKFSVFFLIGPSCRTLVPV